MNHFWRQGNTDFLGGSHRHAFHADGMNHSHHDSNSEGIGERVIGLPLPALN